jgi:hypothetical protein
MHDLYWEQLGHLVKKENEKNREMRALGTAVEDISFPVDGSVFPVVTFNLGPAVATWPHKDDDNFAPGWCAITAIGDYDPTRGGHIVLWELGLVVEFPPGTTIFIPSALITHSNTAVQPGETRMSIVQYAPAGLFRWAWYGFETKGRKDVEDPDKKSTREKQREKERDRYMALYSKYEELLSGSA